MTATSPTTGRRSPATTRSRPAAARRRSSSRIGAGARAWLLEAAAAGTARMNVKMAEAVTLAKISGTTQVDQALGEAAIYGRFATGDLASILGATVSRGATRARRTRRRRWRRAPPGGPRSASQPHRSRGRRPTTWRTARERHHGRSRTAGGAGGVDAAAEDALRPRARAGADRDRESATVGTGRGDQGAVRRGDHRPVPVHARHPPQGRRVPDREDLRHLGRDRLLDPRPRPSTRCGPWNGSAGRRTSSSAGRPGPGRRSSSRPSASRSSRPGCGSPGSASRTSAR